MRALICTAMLALATATAGAQTGNEMYQGCRLLSQHELPKTITDALNAGFCAGLITAITDSHSLVCPPEGTNATQSAAALMRFMDEHPEVRHEDLYVLTVMALRDAWPCKPKRSCPAHLLPLRGWQTPAASQEPQEIQGYDPGEDQANLRAQHDPDHRGRESLPGGELSFTCSV